MRVKRLALQFDLVLDHEILALVVDLLGKFGRYGVVSRLVLQNKTLVVLDALEDGRLFNSPVADVGPFLLAALRVLLGMRCLPS